MQPCPTVQNAVQGLFNAGTETRPEGTFGGINQLHGLVKQMEVCKANNAVQKTLPTANYFG